MTFAEHRATRFNDAPCSRAICEYLEQLASQTGTNIDHWSLEPFVAIADHDRRAVNRIFFAHDTQKEDFQKIDETTESLLSKASEEFESARESRIQELETQFLSRVTHSQRAIQLHQTCVREAWDVKKEIYALQQRPANYITEDVRKLLADGFWAYHKYESGKLFLRTRHNVVMTETNPSAGIDRRVVMGKYLASLKVAHMKLQVHRHQRNILSDGYYHPYVDTEGDICWGNAGSTADKMLTDGKVYEVFSLLASLLVTYAPDATPYERLVGFEDNADRPQDGDEHSRSNENECEECGNDRDDCECCYCEICDQRTGDQPCEDHYCTTCGHYSSDPSACCCSECERSVDDCERCRECDRHDGHASDCEQRPCPGGCESPVSDCQCVEETSEIPF